MSLERKLTIWGFVVGLVSAVLGLWQYVETRQLAQLTYSITNETVYRPSSTLETSLSISGSEERLTSRVVQSIVTVWNGGNVPFRGEDVRSKLTISGDSSVSILSHKITLTKLLPGSKGFSTFLDENRLAIDWHLFDPGEGIQLAILTTGNSGSIDLSGRFLPGHVLVKYPVRSVLKSLSFFGSLIVAAFVLLLILIEISPLLTLWISSPFVRGAVTFAIVLIALACLGYTGYSLVNSARAYVGDISPIDPELRYLDINRNLDYRYVPM